jgi:hypothetical protein
MKFAAWTTDDWVRHYAGPRWSGRADPGSAWDAQGRRVPGEMVRIGGERTILMVADVREAKAQLDQRFGKLADEMAACNMLDQAEREAFDAHVAEWRTFFCGGAPDGRREPHVEVVGLAAQMNQVDRFEHVRRVWAERLAEHYKTGETEEDRAEKRRKPALILAAIAGFLYFFGPPLHRELFGPVVIHKDLVARRRQKALDSGDLDVALETGKGIGADLAAKVNDVLNLAPYTNRGVIQPEPKQLPPGPENAVASAFGEEADATEHEDSEHDDESDSESDEDSEE